MGNLRIVCTDKRRILAISHPTTIQEILETEENIVQNWYYNQPQELESFLKIYPEKEDDVLKAFSYWIIRKVMGFCEQQSKYGTIKRELQNFSKSLFAKLRGLAGRIAKQVAKVLKPKRQMYNEEREKKLNSRKALLGQEKLTSKQERTIAMYKKMIAEYYRKQTA